MAYTLYSEMRIIPLSSLLMMEVNQLCGILTFVVISRVLPNAKFIVVMRNPITRLYSHFLYSFRYYFGSMRNWLSKVRRREEEIFHTQVITEIMEYLEVLSVFECTIVWECTMHLRETLNLWMRRAKWVTS